MPGSTRTRRARRDALRGAARGGAVGFLVLGGVLIALGAGVLGVDEEVPSPAVTAPTTSASADPTVPAGRVVEPGRERTKRSPMRAAAPPTGLTVPALGIKAPVTPVEVSPDGVLDPPGDVSAVGWWQRSAPAGADRGQTVLTGHSVHTGGGVMDDLEDLRRGDKVRLLHDGEVMRYRVGKVRVWTKAQVAEKAEAIFAQDRQQGRLVLVTCEDWDGSDWQSNVVVFASPLRT